MQTSTQEILDKWKDAAIGEEKSGAGVGEEKSGAGIGEGSSWMCG